MLARFAQQSRLANVSFQKNMWQFDSDVPECCVVFDLEWLGNSLVPRTTQLTQLAAVHVSSQKTFTAHVRPIASRQAQENKLEKMGLEPCNQNSDNKHTQS